MPSYTQCLVACTACVGHACLNLACIASQFHPHNLKNKGSMLSWFHQEPLTLMEPFNHTFFIVERVSLDYEVLFTLRKMVLLRTVFNLWSVRFY